ncbi:hypothetical protein ACFODZ_13580 [Marinicella sediminis]|uniref:Uncharacterized protein n=1 Tax=Marinicella sediminis TaxID=1792834 RepID=A0ABV7JBB1_9GAMM|nr:hypothetical protein [Marinicella sediminis]
MMFLYLAFSGQLMAREIPEALAEWQEWVSHNQQFRECPFYASTSAGNPANHLCAWPHQLALEVQQSSASFAITWEVMQPGWVSLPGNPGSWPQEVTINQQPAVVQQHHSLPRVYLQAGRHQLNGVFRWQSRPESITIPAAVADIQLTLDDQPVRFPVLEGQALWLGETIDEQQVEANSLDIEVNRLIIDGHPMTVFVAIDLQVSGVARDENLGRILTDAYQITRVGGDYNAWVDPNGDLWAQLKPGYGEILVGMNILGWPDQLSFVATGDAWPKQEIWAYQDNKNIRLTQIEGVAPVNPEQTFSRWEEVPNYLLNQGDVMHISEQKRGTLNQNEQLHLSREAWLSFNGGSYRTKDQITGEKFGSWRLNAQEGLQLLSAKSDDESLLITRSESGQQGVELRKPAVGLVIDGETGEQILNQINGWDISFESVSTRLYLPHGHLALAAWNVDKSRNVWLDQWQLWDIFIIMLLTVLSFKIIGLKSALMALLTLLLGYHEFNMPVYAWGNLILALALVAWIPKGRWLRLFQTYAVVSLATLVLWLIPQLIQQARLSMHPQLEQDRYSVSGFAPQSKTRAPSLNKVYSQTYNVQNVMQDEDVMEQGKITVTGSRIKRADILNRYQTDALIQAGKGTPQWQHNAVELNWDGPITADQSYQLVVLSPWMRVIWRLSLIFASIWWLWSIASHMKHLFAGKNRALTAGLVWLLVLGLAPLAQANTFPPDELLKQLQDRLFDPPECQGECAMIEHAEVNASGQQLELVLTWHALADVAVPIPQSKDWQLTVVAIDDQLIRGRIQHKGNQWIALKKGIHQVSLSGRLANRNTIELTFPMKPGVLTTRSDDWQFAGMDGLQMSSDTLQLLATNQSENHDEGAAQATDIKPFVKLTRSIWFDDQWSVHNDVERVAPEDGVLSLRVPLMEHEFPIEKLNINDVGEVLVNLTPDDNSLLWSSRLERVSELTLTAANNEHYLEEWRLMASPQWHIELSGIPLVAEESVLQDTDDYFVHIYLPRPGEQLNVSVSRPAAVAGAVLSVDAVDTTYTVGKRTTKATTKITYRATQGGQFAVNLDPQAMVKSVTFDGVESNLANENGVVTVSYLPGAHSVNIEWHVNQSLSMMYQTPEIRLADAYSNLNQTIKIPRDRWVLFGRSEGVGPAFLYWGELLVFIILAVFFSRMKYSPLKTWQWLVLGCAFGTFSWPAFVLVAGWLYFIGWKQQFAGFTTRGKNILLQWFALLFSVLALGVLIGVVAYGLLSYPDMGVAGARSSAYQLHWYLDQGQQLIPDIGVFSLHLWWYKLLILLWSIWVSFALLSWIKTLFQGFQADHWWPKFKRKNKAKAAKEE